jgi:cation transport ATPase
VAGKLGLDQVEAGVEPQHPKTERVQQLRKQGDVVAMAGDGIDDAPALAAAHVGIAMDTGTVEAMESAGITLVKGDLRGIAKAVALSRSIRWCGTSVRTSSSHSSNNVHREREMKRDTFLTFKAYQVAHHPR